MPVLLSVLRSSRLLCRNPTITMNARYASRRSFATPKNNVFRSAVAPSLSSPASVRKITLAGGAAIGLTALCYYGAAMSGEDAAIDRYHVWPSYVKQRIQATYAYVGSGLAVTALSAAYAARSRFIMRFMTSSSIVGVLVPLGLVFASGIAVQSIPYTSSVIGAKQIAWMGHSALVGCVLAPLAMMGGPLLIRCAWYTGGILSGLSAVAVCAPSDKFLSIGGPLAIGLGAVIASSVASVFVPSAIGAGLHTFSMYGGLAVFSGLLLFHTQRVVRTAETLPVHYQYDPVNGAIGLYMTIINMFINIANFLAGGRRK